DAHDLDGFHEAGDVRDWSVHAVDPGGRNISKPNKAYLRFSHRASRAAKGRGGLTLAAPAANHSLIPNQGVPMSRPLALLLAALVVCIPAAAQQRHSAEEQGIKSLESKIKTELTLVNKTKQTVKVFWIDYKGKRKLDATLKPEETHNVTTYLTHPWLVTDAKENAWAIYLPDAQWRTVDIVVPPKVTPTSAYEKRTMHGFTVMIHPEVLRHEADAAEAVKEMDKQLAYIAGVVPDGPLGHIRKVTVWLEWDTPGTSAARFHLPGSEAMLRLRALNPDKAGGVDVNHLRHFAAWSRIDQPCIILHEMAHAYHFRVLGEQHGGIRAAYKQA